MHPKVAELLKWKFDDQRSPEWFALRGNMLTASDVAAAIGVNFFKHPEALIVEKCGHRTFDGNAHTARGVRLEPIVREMYEKQTGTRVHEFGLMVHSEYKWLGGSPDGITEDEGILVEIKCPRKLSKKVPEYYVPQIQVLLEIFDLEACDFIQYCEETDELRIVRVPRDRAWFAENLPKMRAFWERVLYKRTHGLSEFKKDTSPRQCIECTPNSD